MPTGSARERQRGVKGEGGGGAHLVEGTGNPCAGHKRSKLAPARRTIEWLLSSEENVGLLAPTGSGPGPGQTNMSGRKTKPPTKEAKTLSKLNVFFLSVV